MTTIPQILKDCRAQMDKAIESSKREFLGIRSGKASPSMLDTVRVELYGTQMSLNQVAGVSAPEPRVIIVTPFDKGQIKAIEKAIRESDRERDHYLRRFYDVREETPLHYDLVINTDVLDTDHAVAAIVAAGR